MPNAHAADQRPQIQAGEGRRHFRCKWILTVLVVIVAASYIVPERVKQAVVVRCSGVRGRAARLGRVPCAPAQLLEKICDGLAELFPGAASQWRSAR